MLPEQPNKQINKHKKYETVKCKPLPVPKQQATNEYDEGYKCPRVRNMTSNTRVWFTLRLKNTPSRYG